MTPDAYRDFPAKMSALADATAFVEDFAGRCRIDHDDGLRLVLIVEELFTNTVTHGYGGDSEGTVRIALSSHDDAIEIRFEDEAPRYDPLARLSRSPADIDARLESQRPGGLGVHLVTQLTEGARYAYEDCANRLWLVLRRRS